MVSLLATGNWLPFVVIRFCQTIMQRIERRSRRAVRRHVSSVIGFAIEMGSALCVTTRYGEAFKWRLRPPAESWELRKRLAGARNPQIEFPILPLNATAASSNSHSGRRT